ncbi:MAG: DUF2339 domain-containing protein, partial [Chloroflexota bacterium]|nr:DUF2339 domain-containing protein [Chloroflexota bacterium]
MADTDHRLESLERRVASLERRAQLLEERASPDADARRSRVVHTTSTRPPEGPLISTLRAAPPCQESASYQPTQSVPATPPPAPPAVRERRQPAWSWSDLEQLLTGRLLAWAGGLAILCGALFFLVQAFRNNWITESGRVGIGVATGAALLLAGARLLERREVVLGNVLVATGLGTLSLALVAATRLYGLIPTQVGLLFSLAIAIATSLIAVRANSQVIAAYGIVTALAAPPFLGADPTLATVAFVGAALVGVAGIALYRSWNWLPPIAFLLSAPQFVAWIAAEPPQPVALAALAMYCSLYILTAGGEEFSSRTSRLRPASATLLLANAAFLVGSGFVILNDEGARAGLLLCAAVVHILLGAYFLFQENDRYPFGLLAIGTGVAALTIAVPVWLGGPVVPVSWAAEAAALAWVYSNRRHLYSAGMAAILGLLAIGHLVTFEYPALYIPFREPVRTPFLNGEWGTLAFMLGALGVAVYWLRSRNVRTTLATVGFVLTLYALPFEV